MCYSVNMKTLRYIYVFGLLSFLTFAGCAYTPEKADTNQKACPPEDAIFNTDLGLLQMRKNFFKDKDNWMTPEEFKHRLQRKEGL